MSDVADELLLLGLHKHLENAQLAAARYVETREERSAGALCRELSRVQQILQHLPNAATPLATYKGGNTGHLTPLAVSSASSALPAGQEQVLFGKDAQDASPDSIDCAISSSDFDTPVASPNSSNDFDQKDGQSEGKATLQHMLNSFVKMDIHNCQNESAPLQSSGQPRFDVM